MRKMIDRTEERFDVKPDWIAADTAYGSEDNLVWLALKRQILPFIPVFHCPVGDCEAICREGQGRARGWYVLQIRLHMG